MDCKHCKFINDRFLKTDIKTDREYWLMTEVFVYLHGTDVCNGNKNTRPGPKRKLVIEIPDPGFNLG